jgi:hypothetical protein
MKQSSIFILLLAAFISLFAVGCEDREESDTPRLFKPTNLSLKVSYNNVSASWKSTYGAEGYEIEASVSATFETVDAVIQTNAATLSTQFKGLKEKQLYYFRLRGTMNDPQYDSKYIYAQATTQEAYYIFYPVDPDSVSYSSIVLKLREKPAADKLTIFNTSNEEIPSVDRPVTSGEIATQRIKIEGLKAGTSYKAILYNGVDSVGYMVFSIPALPEKTVFINNDNKDNLQSLLDNAEEGSTLLFDGEVFDFSTTDIILSKTVTLMGEPGVPKPKLYVKNLLIGGRSAAPSVTVGKITLLRIEFSGYQLSGSMEQTSVEPNRYLLSCDFTQTPDVTIQQIEVQNCIIRNYGYSFLELNDKLKENPSVNKAVINQITLSESVAFDLGRNNSGYASLISICNSTANNGYCEKYNIRNSTFHHLLRGLIEDRIYTSKPDINVLIDACTFDYIGKKDPAISGLWYGTNTEAKKSVFDFTTASGTDKVARVSISKSVFGEMFSEKISSFTAGLASTASTNEAYMLAASKTVLALITYPASINATIDQLFPFRANDKYTLGEDIDIAVKNAGDPRWK